jgi:hypothetical protein
MVKLDHRNILFISIHVFLILYLQISNINCEYENENEPECQSNCDSLTDPVKQAECQKKYLEFYSYKLVKSIFNFAKVSIFAGLWASRYVSKIYFFIFLNLSCTLTVIINFSGKC